MRRISFILTATYLFVACSGEGEKDKKNQETPVSEAFLKNVKTVSAVLKSQEEDLVLTGKVEYDPDRIVEYSPIINGVVTNTFFSLGDKVGRGQVLAYVKSMEVNSLKSEKASLQAELMTAKRELQSAESMHKDNMLSDTELAEARAKVRQASAELGRVNSDMQVTGTNSKGGFSITSPMSGYIVSKNIASGMSISPDSDPLFTVADLSQVWISANVYASNLQFVKEGMPVEMTSLSYPGEVFEGRVTHISQVFDSEERVLKARIVMANPELKFKPEMSMIIKLKNNTENMKVSVPVKALIFDENKDFVIVEESNHNFKIKEIKLLGHNDDTAYIASGISEGEKVVIKDQLLIYSHLKNK
ncbi:efflux RND transporter periplasmic adaptor subunit [Apibacter sp. HY039]|uniref:efflux RND transporter periplasmic adaptor subunit n=1 Tax=Apibacter sp. HY039 TaxID=2501476 RepID=UPI000FEBA4DA|nr:efflux RND transporter periplasmic adaptor subunit [Apibacter sp. HY039]